MPAFAADADTWMASLAKAGQSHSYAGTFVYGRDGSFSSHAVWRQVKGGEVRERLLQLDGPAVEVVRINGQVQCSSDEFASAAEPSQAWQNPRFDAKALSEWYEFRVIGESRIADRPAVAIAVLARDQHRYSFELHLDRETAFPIKSLMLSEKGQLLERLQFTHFEAGNVPAPGLKATAACKPVEHVERTEPSSGWRADWLPPGFKLLESAQRPGVDADVPVTWLSYGDGLARFSVFIEPLRGAQVHDARSQMGPTVVVSKRISGSGGDVMVTVVGEVPLGTAERVALSARSEGEAAGQ